MAFRCRQSIALLALALIAACGRSASSSGASPVNRRPLGFIDEPSNGAHVGRSFVMRGWALDDGGVASIRLFVDGRFITTIDRRYSRPDLDSSYPKLMRPPARNGWVGYFTFPATAPPGPHALMVQLADDAGATKDLGPYKIVFDPEPDPAADSRSPTAAPGIEGELPFGAVDRPVELAHVLGNVEVAGWALDDRGVREIRVFLDRTYVTSFELAGSNSELMTRFPHYTGAGRPNAWHGVVMLPSSLTPGPHSLLFQAIDTDNLTRVIGLVHVIVDPGSVEEARLTDSDDVHGR